jgi:hypothetical protein
MGSTIAHRVFANEQHGVSMHCISQKAFICVNLVRGVVFDH